MTRKKQLPQKLRQTEWQSLGEIKLPAGPAPAARRIITAWLRECIRPLRLPNRFAKQVTSSALEASSHALKPGQNPLEAPYLVLCIYVPQAVLSGTGKGETWGLVTIEEDARKPQDTLTASESIDLYLFPESH